MTDDLISELFSDVEAEGSVLVVHLALLLVAQDAVSVIDLLELKKKDFVFREMKILTFTLRLRLR